MSGTTKGNVRLVCLLVVVGCAWPCAAADLTVVLPPSDVVAGGRPYRIGLKAGQGISARDGQATITLRRQEPGLEKAPALTSSAAFQLAKRDANASEADTFLAIDASALAEGEYAGQLTLRIGGSQQATAVRFFRMPEGKCRPFPFGIYATPFGKTPAEQAATLQALNACGINLLCQHMSGMEKLTAVYDRAARLGMTFMPSSNSCGWGVKMDEAMKGRLAGGGATRLPCLNNPAVRQGAARMFAGWLRQYVEHPAFSGMVYYGDDFALEMKRGKAGRVELACYCDTCKRDFRKLTGKDIPATCEPTEGVVPADHPFLRWMRYRSGNLYAGFMAEMRKAKDGVDPAVRIGSIHGWSEQPFVNLAAAVYAPLSQSPCDVVSSYCYPELVSPRMDLIAQYEIARMADRNKDVWMLGELGVFHFMSPPWMVRQNYWNMLASGYRLIAFFSWHDYAQAIAKGRQREAEAAVAALAECARHNDWLLPVAGLWQDPPVRDAMLYSFTTDAFEILPSWRGGEHQEAVTAQYRHSLRRHVPMRIVSEEEIRAGILDRLDSLCLHGVRALPDDVHKLIAAAAAAGKAVYVPMGAPISVGHSRYAAFDTALALIARSRRPPVEIDNRDVTLRELLAGDARYYVFVNNACDRYWGMSCSWGNTKATYADAELVKDPPVEAAVAFRDKGRWLFDLDTGRPAGRTDDALALKLAPSSGRVLVALPAAKAVVKVAGPATAAQGATAVFGLKMLDGEGKVLNGAFAARVTVRTPSGRTSRYSGPLPLSAGAARFALPIGANDETGTWTFRFEGGLPRQAVGAKLEVTRAPGPRQLLTVRPAQATR